MGPGRKLTVARTSPSFARPWRSIGWIALPLLLVGLVSAAHAEDAKTSTLLDDVSAWARAATDDERGVPALQIVARAPKAEDLVAALNQAMAPNADSPKGEVVTWKHTRPDGTEHSIFAQAPSSYDPARPLPLLVWLHGAVSRGPDGGGQSGLRLWSEVADEQGFLLLCPSGRPGAVWWDPAGRSLLRAALVEMGRRYAVDRQRIAIGGFSDGGSACYHLLVADPTPYCCFFALSGHPLVARMFGGPTHTANLAARPVFATHGSEDTLYPTARMQPLVEALQAKGARIDWQNLEGKGHNWDAVRPLTEALLTYWRKHTRGTAAPAEVAWQTALPEAYGRLEWIEIEAVDPKAPRTDAFDVEVVPMPPLPPPRPRLGITLDTGFEGPGVRVRSVQDDTPAKEAGLQEGDVILAVDGSPLASAEDLPTLRDALQKMAADKRDGVFRVKRGDDELDVKTRPRSLASDARRLGPGHDKPLGKVVAVAVGGNRFEVGTVNVSHLRLHLDASLIDFEKPVVVVLNGQERHNAKVLPDTAYMLTEAHRLGHAPATRAALSLFP